MWSRVVLSHVISSFFLFKSNITFTDYFRSTNIFPTPLHSALHHSSVCCYIFFFLLNFEELKYEERRIDGKIKNALKACPSSHFKNYFSRKANRVIKQSEGGNDKLTSEGKLQATSITLSVRQTRIAIRKRNEDWCVMCLFHRHSLKSDFRANHLAES